MPGVLLHPHIACIQKKNHSCVKVGETQEVNEAAAGDKPANRGRIQLSVCLFDLRRGETGTEVQGQTAAVGVVNLSVGHSFCLKVKLC